MKDEEIYGFFGTTGHETQHDGKTYPELLKNILRAEYNLKSGRVYFQALHNKFAKKLGVPAVRLKCEYLDGVAGSFCSDGVKNSTKTT